MEKYLEWLKEQLRESREGASMPYMDDYHYNFYNGRVDALEDAIHELEDGLRYSKKPEVEND